MSQSAELIALHTTPETRSQGRARGWMKVAALIALFSSAAAYEAFHLSALTTPDVWVHLRTGVWMVQNHSVPQVGLFSQFPELRWNDSTWGFDLLLGVGYSLFGLRAIPLVLMALKVAVAVAIFLLARIGRLSFWAASLVAALGQYVVPVHPMPYAVSIVFCTVEFIVLMRSRQTGSSMGLLCLPILFVVWANFHVQFVAGLFLFALFVVAATAERALCGFSDTWFSKCTSPAPTKQAAILFGLSVFATLLNPYGYRLVPTAIHALYSPVGFEHFAEMSSMTFRRPQDFVLMLLVMMAFLALGRRRSVEMFDLLALIAGTVAAFRIDRDGWMAVLPAVAVLAGGLSRDELGEQRRVGFSAWHETAWAAVVSLIVLGLCSLAFLPGSDALLARASRVLPVKACDFIRANKLSPPLFNTYSWGGFVTWYLPDYPVAVDSRAELYGEQILGKYFDVVSGKELLESEPMVSGAGTLLLEKDSAMAKALTNLPALRSQYRLVYGDDIASVFVPERNAIP